MNKNQIFLRITAIWALSESALGGILHAVKIPLTGLFIGGSAVVLLTLMAYLGAEKKDFLKAFLLVLIVKAVVSPHTPPTAYLAVSFQAFLAIFLFGFIRIKSIAAMLLSVFSLVESGFQKLLVLTLIFGQNLWDSINIFASFIVMQFMQNNEEISSVNLSLVLITGYLIIHLIAGLLIGGWASTFSKTIFNKLNSQGKTEYFLQSYINIEQPLKKKKRVRFAYLVFPLAVVIMVLSYIMPVFDRNVGLSALAMVVRATVILIFWYYILGPYVKRILLNFLQKKKNKYNSDIEEIFVLFPTLKQIVASEWKIYQQNKPQISFRDFLENIFLIALTIELEKEPS
ncbi:MAG: hypothetical protein D8M58_00505 [Calditrichaeota bacterium]|nr:MAG: hypothetical protein DWQ03_06575 [Calditrichota bacterium]MBL1203850.1 hypothetical protein [Calditrichota bacterium]NOG43682.1 hypothetical protein [Calditrichota bacterium]